MAIPTAAGPWWHSACFTHADTLWLRRLSLVPRPRRDGEGPESHRQPLCCRRGNQPLYVRHVFLFVLLFLSNVGEGECFPSHPPMSSPITHLSSPPTNPSKLASPLHLLLLSFSPGDHRLWGSLLRQPISSSWCCQLLFIWPALGFQPQPGLFLPEKPNISHGLKKPTLSLKTLPHFSLWNESRKWRNIWKNEVWMWFKQREDAPTSSFEKKATGRSQLVLFLHPWRMSFGATAKRHAVAPP